MPHDPIVGIPYILNPDFVGTLYILNPDIVRITYVGIPYVGTPCGNRDFRVHI